MHSTMLLAAVLAIGCGGPAAQECDPGQIALRLHMSSYCASPCERDADCTEPGEPRCMAMAGGPHFCAADIKPR